MLAPDQQGWDWFSLRLDNNTALMVYRIRSEQRDYLYGSVMKQGGDIRTLSEIDVNLVEVKKAGRADGKYPQSFKLSIIKEGIDIDVNVVNPNQVMRFGIEYFEGMVTFSGSHQGEGFLEMTGYQ
jgi:predicted secreted hydrolase